MKRISSLLILSGLIFLCTVPCMGKKSNNSNDFNGKSILLDSKLQMRKNNFPDIMQFGNKELVRCDNMIENSLSANVVFYETAEQEYRDKMSELVYTENLYQWYLEYKDMIEKYSDELDRPETIYDCFTEAELSVLFGVVEAEVGGLGGFRERCNVASVIFNRLYSDKFDCDSLSDVLTENQFSTIRNGMYKRVDIIEETILACEFAFAIEDTANGALFFESGDNDIHSNYAEYIFTDHAGHKFYK